MLGRRAAITHLTKGEVKASETETGYLLYTGIRTSLLTRSWQPAPCEGPPDQEDLMGG
jgi:hypothetical protein